MKLNTTKINCTGIFLILVTFTLFCINWTYSSTITLSHSLALGNNDIDTSTNIISQVNMENNHQIVCNDDVCQGNEGNGLKVLTEPDLTHTDFIVGMKETEKERKLLLISNFFAWPGNSDTFHIIVSQTDYEHSIVPQLLVESDYYTFVALDPSDPICKDIPSHINTMKGFFTHHHCYKLTKNPEINDEIRLFFGLNNPLSYTGFETYHDKLYQFVLTISPPGMTAIGKTFDFSFYHFFSPLLNYNYTLEPETPILDGYNKVNLKVVLDQAELFKDILLHHFKFYISLDLVSPKNPGWHFTSYKYEINFFEDSSPTITSEVTIPDVYLFIDGYLKDRVALLSSPDSLQCKMMVYFINIGSDNSATTLSIIKSNNVQVVDLQTFPSWNAPISFSLKNGIQSYPSSTKIKVDYDFAFEGSVGNYLLQFFLNNTLVSPSPDIPITIELGSEYDFCSIKITDNYILTISQKEVTGNLNRRCIMKISVVIDSVDTSSEDFNPEHYRLNLVYSDPYNILPDKELNYDYLLTNNNDDLVMKITSVYAPESEDVIIQTRFQLALIASYLNKNLQLVINKHTLGNNKIVKRSEKDWEKSVYLKCSYYTEKTYLKVNDDDNAYVFNLFSDAPKYIPNQSTQLVFCELVVGLLLIDDIELHYSFLYESKIASSNIITFDHQPRHLFLWYLSEPQVSKSNINLQSDINIQLELEQLPFTKDLDKYNYQIYHEISLVLENNFLTKVTRCTVNEVEVNIAKLGNTHFVIPIIIAFDNYNKKKQSSFRCTFHINAKYVTPVESAFTFVFSDNLHLLDNIASKTKISQKDLWAHSLDNFSNPKFIIPPNNNTRSVPITTVTWRDIENILARRLKDIKDLYYKAGGTQLKKDLIHLVDLTANGSHTIVDVDVDVDIIYTASIGYEGDFPFNLDDFQTSLHHEINQSPDLHDMSVEVKLEQVPSKCLSAASTCGEECVPCLGTEECKNDDDCFSGVCQEGKCKEYSTLTSPEDNHSHVHQVSGVLILILSFIGLYLV